MEISKIIELEKSNDGFIYFFANSENEFVAYEFSAFIASEIFHSINLERDYSIQNGKAIFSARIFPEIIRNHFSGPNTSVGNDYVQVSLSDSFKEKLPDWIKQFEKLKCN